MTMKKITGIVDSINVRMNYAGLVEVRFLENASNCEPKFTVALFPELYVKLFKGVSWGTEMTFLVPDFEVDNALEKHEPILHMFPVGNGPTAVCPGIDELIELMKVDEKVVEAVGGHNKRIEALDCYMHSLSGAPAKEPVLPDDDPYTI